MSGHIRITERPRLPVPPPPMVLDGVFPGYEYGQNYAGSISILNSVGRCTVELISGELPAGYTLSVDNFTKQVVLRWPGHTEEEEVSGLINGDFQQGPLGWELPSGWAVEAYEKQDISPTPAPGNLAAVFRGMGRGDHAMRSITYPCPPGTEVSASGLWDQGPSNKDNVNLNTNLLFFNSAGGLLHREWGDRIHDRTNKNRHLSEVTALAPIGTAAVALENNVHRRNKRNREVIVDDCAWNLRYMTQVPTGDYSLCIRVRDSSGQVAEGCYTISQLSEGELHWDISTATQPDIYLDPNRPWVAYKQGLWSAVRTIRSTKFLQQGFWYWEMSITRFWRGGADYWTFPGLGTASLNPNGTIASTGGSFIRVYPTEGGSDPRTITANVSGTNVVLGQISNIGGNYLIRFRCTTSSTGTSVEASLGSEYPWIPLGTLVGELYLAAEIRGTTYTENPQDPFYLTPRAELRSNSSQFIYAMPAGYSPVGNLL